MLKNSPFDNNFFEMKQMIEDLEDELTRSLIKLVDPKNRPAVQRTTYLKSNGPVSKPVCCLDNEQMYKHSAA